MTDKPEPCPKCGGEIKKIDRCGNFFYAEAPKSKEAVPMKCPKCGVMVFCPQCEDAESEKVKPKPCPKCGGELDISILEWLKSPIGTPFYHRCKCGYKVKVTV